ncbi:pol-like protein [Colletotrichum plurivorum]|uniref:Pol-like protein n=1 Tax=Colletotrichum plurivorum TaxID=2175906 RepID=A0A8H6JA16_9PEZI|nr:pol-like protein [Colletotrichum plurivorum]
MRAKLQVDQEAFGGDAERFAYIYARLEGTAQMMSSAFYAEGSKLGFSPDQFMDYMERRYGDPNAKVRALDRLRSLRQKDNESFASFFPKFENELANSGGGSWADIVRINYLEGTLNDTLRGYLIGIPISQRTTTSTQSSS